MNNDKIEWWFNAIFLPLLMVLVIIVFARWLYAVDAESIYDVVSVDTIAIVEPTVTPFVVEDCCSSPESEPEMDFNDPINFPIIMYLDRIEAEYTSEDIMCITNMVYGEISAITYDKNYTWEEQNLVLQEWARIPINHIKYGIADNIPELMKKTTSSGYYVWHKIYGTEEYMRQCLEKNPELYERCRINVFIALSGCMQEQVPESVIYADLNPHGDIFKTYRINTGYYSSTVYLCYDK